MCCSVACGFHILSVGGAQLTLTATLFIWIQTVKVGPCGQGNCNLYCRFGQLLILLFFMGSGVVALMVHGVGVRDHRRVLFKNL